MYVDETHRRPPPPDPPPGGPPPPRVNHLAARMGRWSAAHWKTAVIGWLIFVIGAAFVGAQIGTKEIDENNANVGESQEADEIINEAGFTLGADGESVDTQTEFILIQSTGLAPSDPAYQAAIQDTVDTLQAFPQVQDLRSPLDPAQPDLVSADGMSVMIQFTPAGTYDEAAAYIGDIEKAVDGVAERHGELTFDAVGLTTDVELQEEVNGGLAKAGLLSIPLTVGILMLVLGGFVAAGIPLLIGVTSVVAASGFVAMSSQGIPADESIMEVVLLVGLAVGVDYSLFYMRREREERAAGRTEGAALEAAAATSGHAVLVSGMTVLIAMAGMFLSGDKTFMSFSVGTMIVVAVAMIGSLTVLPALLGKLGDRVQKGRIPLVHRLHREAGKGRMWGAVLKPVLKRPLLWGLAAAVLLVGLAIPATQLNTTQTGADGITSPAIEPYNEFVDAFPGTPEPAVVAVEADDVNAPEVQEAISLLTTRALESGQVQTPVDVTVNPDGTVAKVELPLVGDGVDSESTDALQVLRDELLPQTLGQVEGVEYAVTGLTANSEDFNEALQSSMPLVFGFVLLFAFLLLLYSFRSIVIAVKAILLNLLSVAAAYGVLVATFQWGWGENLFDFSSNGGIANWIPMFMFVILFGLSMDYHVFILSRIREAFDRGMSTEKAIEHGIRSTAGTVTSAAFVMVGVFMVFTMLPVIDLKEMGVGLAAAVLIDATIVRAVLLPASMKLLGDANWYLPRWLQWLPQRNHGVAPEPVGARRGGEHRVLEPTR